jgi:HlyD family secretion protein
MARESKNNGRGRRVAIVLVLVVAAVLLFTGINRRRVVTPVRAEKVVRQEIASVISTNGKIEPVNSFEAHAPAPATVNRVLVAEGDHVKAGQLLVKLDDAEARAQAARALSQLRSAEAALSGIKAGGTQEEVLTTRSDLVKAQAERDDAQQPAGHPETAAEWRGVAGGSGSGAQPAEKSRGGRTVAASEIKRTLLVS